ncbi:hypothetical protein G6F35_007009 [Rhizopus arrhizus]|nr:hypothetical protein G6F35_007009 [Rhizopus arrhizus]
MPYATAQPLHPQGPPMNLVLYGMDRELLPRLAAKLPPTTTLHWQDSNAPTSAQDLQRGGQSLVLLDFRPEHAAASSALAQQLQQTQPDLVLVAVGATSAGQVEGVVIALRAGLRDVLDLDSDNAGIEAALRRALSPRPTASPQLAHKARLIVLLGVRAGVGTSTLAAHLSVLAQQTRTLAQGEALQQDGLLMELAQPSGDLALYLNLDSRFHYEDALRNASRIDATLARTAMARHDSGLVLLDRAGGTPARGLRQRAVRCRRLPPAAVAAAAAGSGRRNLAGHRRLDRYPGVARPGAEASGGSARTREAAAAGDQSPRRQQRHEPRTDRAPLRGAAAGHLTRTSTRAPRCQPGPPAAAGRTARPLPACSRPARFAPGPGCMPGAGTGTAGKTLPCPGWIAMEDKVTPFPHAATRPVLPDNPPGHLPFAQTEQYQKVLSAAHEHLLNSIEDERIDIDSWAPDTIARWVQVQTVGFIQEWRIPINEEEMQVVAEGLVKELTGFGPLDDLLHDPSIEDILINGFKDVHVSQGGQLKRATQRFTDDTHLLRILRRILAPLGRRLDDSYPMVDARLPNGGRLNAIISPLAVDGPMVSIRKFRKDPFTPDELLAKGTFDAPMQALLKAMVLGRCNILVSGGTSSGKTSLLNALASYVPPNERVITVEDTAELSLNHPHVVRLESRIGGAEGHGASVAPRCWKCCRR